jgi:hypothetical protein
VTAASALHWFDLPRFYKEVRRVLKPHGCLAAWAIPLVSNCSQVSVNMWASLSKPPLWLPRATGCQSGEIFVSWSGAAARYAQACHVFQCCNFVRACFRILQSMCRGLLRLRFQVLQVLLPAARLRCTSYMKRLWVTAGTGASGSVMTCTEVNNSCCVLVSTSVSRWDDCYTECQLIKSGWQPLDGMTRAAPPACCFVLSCRGRPQSA